MSFKEKLTGLWCRHKPTENQKALALAFIPSAATFGLAAALAVVYFTDWKVIAGWIPLYNTKFPKEEPKKKKKKKSNDE
ncbi:cytochrome b-c1 complex subunit 10 [Drosophila ficusphila]|uniref:cytochrome b-c1 complex subunit 10 n=1 Tax=Drosophila ficusphila TaxID=30025 RepID=UPI0007E6DC8D|nr:cytochrome b-c1 complex subunit 10 [Drosophila ficusphila]